MNNAEVLPSFIREKAGAPPASADLSEIYVFWEPDRFDGGLLDYQIGRQHCETALRFARQVQTNILPAYVFGGICAIQNLASMEQGFIDALAVKATYGRLPDPSTPEAVAELVQACKTTEDEVRYGEAEAREYLVLARETRCPEIIAAMLVSIVRKEMERGALSFFVTVCGAAYLGALH